MIQQEVLDSLKDSSLFYPCSGKDLLIPIQLFSPYITDFWFVDRGYFSSNHQDTEAYGYDIPADKQLPILRESPDYVFIKCEIEGPADWDQYNPHIKPCIQTEFYEHCLSKREIRIHRRRGYGFSAFRTEQRLRSRLGVFFYRGDSMGGGGSGNRWLGPDHLKEVCDILIDGGLVVTDGSNHRNCFKALWKYHRTSAVGMTDTEIVESLMPFTAFSEYPKTFTCIGSVGVAYGPTLVWQVRKSSHR